MKKKRKKNIDKNSKYASSKNILIYTGYMNFLWNDSTLNKQALGGAEKAVIYLSRCLPKNFEIYIAGDQLEEELDNIIKSMSNTIIFATGYNKINNIIA